jgi:hypothetical protein
MNPEQWRGHFFVKLRSLSKQVLHVGSRLEEFPQVEKL